MRHDLNLAADAGNDLHLGVAMTASQCKHGEGNGEDGDGAEDVR
jgi:hypothetical protein